MRRAALAVAWMMSFTAPAFADPNADAEAQRLFDDGRALLQQGRYQEACTKLLASETLAPSGGTLLNLADCYEKAGKPASAWARFREAEDRAHTANRADVEELAKQRALALAAHLSTLTIVVSPENTASSFVVVRAGENVDRVTWGTALPVDPGTYTIEARAPGYQSWKTAVEVLRDADVKTVHVPALALEAAASAPSRPAAAPLKSPHGDHSAQRILLIGSAAAGVVALGAGTGFGVLAITKNNDAKSHCLQSPQCSDAQGPMLTQDAKSAATGLTIAFVAGGVFVAGAVALWLTLPHGASASVGLGSVRLGGTF